MKAMAALAFAAAITPAFAADYPAPKQGEWIAKDFKFHTGEVMKELKLAYTTIGDPKGQPVLVLHGTGGSAQSMLGAGFAGELFGPGQALDASKYYIIIPDALGAGKSAKPSDGLRAKFPRYNYDDMVTAQYLLLKEGLGIKHLRLVIGNSMGGMHTWIWTTKYPGYMDAAVPMASQPTPMASRNWMMRRMLIETIKADPTYKNGDYTEQPPMLKIANVFFGIGTNGGTLRYQALAPTNAKAEEFVNKALAAPMKADANDFLYQWGSSQDFDVSKDLDKIEAQVLVINSADDERNPAETGILDQAMKRVKNGKVYLIPASTETRGHGTTGSMAKLYKDAVADLLKTAPQRGM
ncbi:alpha/beta fold hydrolase [Pseudolabrys sp. FHR47]|uniref:alpha/beta fold hydrolase n=1 Tax=Pseudolabrys sp. FHR47 TaxID=2562284 RepID=UPI00351A6298